MRFLIVPTHLSLACLGSHHTGCLAPAAEPARLPGFHTTVGGGGEKQLPEWYEEKGAH